MTVTLLLAGVGHQAFAQASPVEIQTTHIIDPIVILETNLGEIAIGFFPNDAPNHITNFIKLSQSGFYDGTIFHRIIPGFMVQGGDPNTIDGDPNTWGIGGPDERVDAEFNTIKHNRGIVSMARSADPNSGGSQFFIVHENSNFLDGDYTAFGRIVTEESFQTLDKIAAVQIGTSDRPVDPEQVKITKATVVSAVDVQNLLELSEPERTQSTITPPTGNQKFESAELGIAFSVPEGWLLQQPEKTEKISPDVVAVGPKIGTMNPNISLTIQNTNQKTLDDIIAEKTETVKEIIESGNLELISQEKITVNGNQAYVTEAVGIFFSDTTDFNVKFKEIIIYDTEKFYILVYANGLDDFDSQLPRFEETIDSFKILSQDTPPDNKDECIIATASFGSPMANEVQMLREIRDNQLLKTESGSAFMSGFNTFYYSFAPTVAGWEHENPVFKEVVKAGITPLITSLSLLNYVSMDSEEEVLTYGISLIMLNIGMYFAAPAFVIYKIRK